MTDIMTPEEPPENTPPKDLITNTHNGKIGLSLSLLAFCLSVLSYGFLSNAETIAEGGVWTSSFAMIVVVVGLAGLVYGAFATFVDKVGVIGAPAMIFSLLAIGLQYWVAALIVLTIFILLIAILSSLGLF